MCKNHFLVDYWVMEDSIDEGGKVYARRRWKRPRPKEEESNLCEITLNLVLIRVADLFK